MKATLHRTADIPVRFLKKPTGSRQRAFHCNAVSHISPECNSGETEPLPPKALWGKPSLPPKALKERLMKATLHRTADIPVRH